MVCDRSQSSRIGKAVLVFSTCCFLSVAGKDPCACLNWKEVYESKRVICGEGPEFFTVGGRTSHNLKEVRDWQTIGGNTYFEFCKSFFERFDDNLCVNFGMFPRGTQEWYGGSWCYVSKECQELNGGNEVFDKKMIASWWPKWPSWLFMRGPTRPLVRDVSWKLCLPGQDRRLRDVDPDLVLALADHQNSIKGVVAKLAYTRLMPEIWGDVEEQWIANDTAGLPTMLRDAIAVNEPIVIDVDPDGHGDQKIVWGEDLYSMDNMGPIVCGMTFFCHRREKRGEL